MAHVVLQGELARRYTGGQAHLDIPAPDYSTLIAELERRRAAAPARSRHHFVGHAEGPVPLRILLCQLRAEVPRGRVNIDLAL